MFVGIWNHCSDETASLSRFIDPWRSDPLSAAAILHPHQLPQQTASEGIIAGPVNARSVYPIFGDRTVQS